MVRQMLAPLSPSRLPVAPGGFRDAAFAPEVCPDVLIRKKIADIVGQEAPVRVEDRPNPPLARDRQVCRRRGSSSAEPETKPTASNGTSLFVWVCSQQRLQQDNRRRRR